MKSSIFFRLLLLTLFTLILFANVAPAHAQDKVATQTRRDVDITIQKNGDVQFVETWEFKYTGGPFTFATRGVGLDKVESVTDMQVSENGRSYQAVTSGTNPGTYQVYKDGNQQIIKWYYTPTSNQSRTFVVQYKLRGAVRIYDGGDQFWWNVIESDHGYTIQNAAITVHLPASFPTDQLKAAVTTGRGTATIRDGQTITFTASDMSDGEGLEVRAQFPHGVVTAAPPTWQAAADAEAAAQAQREQAKAPLNLFFLFVGCVFILLGPLGLYLLWYARGRDPAVPQVAQTSAPPSDLPPGVVGTLIDEKADMRDIIATIVDLARRGIIKMTEKESAGFLGIGKTRDFVFERVDHSAQLRDYEHTLIEKIFGASSTRELSDLKEKFYTAIPTLRSEMYDEVVKEKFFPSNPNSTRNKFVGLGFVALFLVGGCGLATYFMFLGDYAELAICPTLSLIVTAIGLMIIGNFMSRRTRLGATEKVKWLAFKRYLESIEKFTKLDQAQTLFDKYLPYAICFGLEKSWVQKFAAVGTPAPTWYETYPPIYYGGSPHRRLDNEVGAGSASGGGLSSGGQMPNLDSASAGAFRGLDSMSSGLFSMLDSTASVFTSAPSSSGGGGWSGGGSGGGGGGGGGGSSSVG